MSGPNLEPLWAWAREREAIRILKAGGGPPPWTGDPVLRAYRFCNVRREDDRVTRWVAARVRKPFARHPHLWFMLCVCRMLNWPDTLAELIDAGAWPLSGDFAMTTMRRVLITRRARGEKVFTGAYVIPPASGYADKVDGVCVSTLGAPWASRARFADLFAHRPTLQATHRMLSGFPGWGPFLAYQAVVDMRFTPLLSRAPDRASWAAAGPGTVRGLNRLHGRPTDARLRQAQALDEMRAIYAVAVAETGVPMDFSDVPNILCEFDKWLRTRNGEGKPRALYVPGRGC